MYDAFGTKSYTGGMATDMVACVRPDYQELLAKIGRRTAFAALIICSEELLGETPSRGRLSRSV